MYRILLIAILLFYNPAYGIDYPYNDTAWWQRVVFEETPVFKNSGEIDTSIVVATNRRRTNDQLRFMSEETGDGAILYFFVYAYHGKWHALKTPDLTTAVQYTPEKNSDWVVYTEGMGKIFTAELYRGMMMTSQYKVNVIMLDYPSITTTKRALGNYLFSMANARAAYKYHVPVLEKIKQMKSSGKLGTGHLSLFFHSMGNYLAREMVKQNMTGNLCGNVWVDNIILNAACVPQRKHSDWLGRLSFARNIYIQYNPEDRTLSLPELLNKKKQLGRRVKKPVDSKAQYVNFHNKVGNGHSYFLTLRGREPIEPKVWDYYNTILHGGNINFRNGKYEVSDYRGIGWQMKD